MSTCITATAALTERSRKSRQESAEGSDADAIDLERLIQRERNPELKEALIDLEDSLFKY